MAAVHPLYSNFLEDKNVYALNMSYWSRQLHRVVNAEKMPIQENLLTMICNDGYHFYDGNPIYDAIVGNRAVRIIQERPDSDELNISAWIDQREVNGQLIDELVIDLELTEESQAKAFSLLSAWLKHDIPYDDMIDAIDKIYVLTNSNSNAEMALVI
jgi:hypothetical protein